jgi:hypothetical protein
MKDSKNTSVAEKMMLSLCIMSIVSIITAITFGILYLIFEKEYMDTIAGYGLTIFILPALILQVMVSADSSYIGSEIKQKYWLYPIFFLIVFPFSIMWFFAGISALYDIVPNYHYIHDRVLRESIRIESIQQSWKYIAIIYISLTILGLSLRIFKRKNKEMILA